MGIPTVEEYRDMYCRNMGIPPIDNWDFYVVFIFFRLASICQGVYKRALQGEKIFHATNREIKECCCPPRRPIFWDHNQTL